MTRQRLHAEGKTGRYLTYAVGEIFLVVVGILIALQVNNWNIDRNDRLREQKYLANIVLDLKKDLHNLDDLSEFRRERLIGDEMIIRHMNGESVATLTDLSKYVVNSMMEKNFVPNNITFSELSSSGNLNIVQNDSIKLLLLELEEAYNTNRESIVHETHDYREYISKSTIRHIDLDQLFPVYLGMKTAEEQQVTPQSFNKLFQIIEYKNALFIMMFMSQTHLDAYAHIKGKSEKIIALIEQNK